MRFVRLIWRLLVLFFALVVAAFVVVVAGLFAVRHLALEGVISTARIDSFEVDSLISLLSLVLVLFTVIAHAFLPWIMAITATELLRLRHIGWHLAAGTLVALAAGIGSGAVLVPGAVMVASVTQLLLALGLVAGFVHWLIAGRNAGRWGEDLTTDTAPRSPETSEK